MQNDVAERKPLSLELQEKVLIGGDLSKLTVQERLSYYGNLCESLDLNPLTRPFEYLILGGKTVLYARKDCTEQLRTKKHISIDPKNFTKEVIEGIYVVTAWASTPEGRTDVATGAVPIDGLKGLDRANAMMKAETKAKRRVTLSICGLGMLDETEIDTIKDAKPVVLDIPQVRPRNDSTMITPPVDKYTGEPKPEEDGAGDARSGADEVPQKAAYPQQASDALPVKSGADLARNIANKMDEQYDDGFISAFVKYQGTKAYQKGCSPGYFDLDDGQGGLIRKFKYMDPALDLSSGLKRVYYRTESFNGKTSYAVTKVEALD